MVQEPLDRKDIQHSWTRDDLEGTDWARSFKKEAPISYEEGIRHALNPKLYVEIYRTYDTGEVLWAISVVIDGESTGFWMDAKCTKIAAVNLCRRMRWKIIG